jgi:hypothetical protein
LNDPTHFGDSITNICKEADISRPTYYDMIKKPEFVEYKNQLTLDVLKSRIDNVINATYKFATTNSKNNADRKLLLEMVGMFVERQKIEHTGENGTPINVNYSEMSEEELKEQIQKLASEIK